MTFDFKKTEEQILVVMNGTLDTLAAEQVEPRVKELEAAISVPVVIDCANLEYISSSGLRLLLRIRKAAAAAVGNKVTLCTVNENIMEVLKVTHFDKMFVIK